MADTTTGGMTAHEHHHKFWSGVKEKAAESMAHICRDSAPCTRKEAVELLADALKHGRYVEAAEAILAASEWVHATDEVKYMEEKE